MRINTTLKPKVFVGMSGGVDSSVAAYLLKKQKHNVAGVFLRCFNLDGCAEQDAQDARRVAQKIGIPFYVWDFEEEYKEKVVDYMIDGYRRGITPNPDVMCNREIKFGLFLKKALEMGANYVATGHYVRLRRNFKFPISNFKTTENSDIKLKFKIQNFKFSLSQAKDANKDQSYFLWTLTQNDLKRCLFPIGDYLKSEVREIAKKAGLPTAEKKDSQGICFLGKITLDDFLSAYLPPKQGSVLNKTGEKIGSHFGAHFYTIGQRHANIVYDPKKIRPDMKPRYIAGKDVKENTVTVAEGDDAPELYRKEIELANVNFINSDIMPLIRANKGYKVMAMVRYRQPLAKATLVSSIKYQVSSGKKNYQNMMHDTCHMTLIFDEGQKFVAPGQSAVFYDNKGVMLGGGVIL